MILTSYMSADLRYFGTVTSAGDIEIFCKGEKIDSKSTWYGPTAHELRMKLECEWRKSLRSRAA